MTAQVQINDTGSTVTATVTESTVTVGVPSAISASYISFTPTGSVAATNVQAAIAEVDAEKQPLDSDLTAIAALTTTAYGRGALTLADAPAFASYSGIPLLATSAITGALTLSKTGTTARTATFPDAAITVAGINLAQTWTQTQTFAAITATGTVTVPDGSAESPGLRTTTEANGIYRASGSLGFTVGGVATLIMAAPNGSTIGAQFAMQTPSAGEYGLMRCSTSATYLALSGDTGPSSGGNARIYGASHATKASYVEFLRGNTVSAYFDGSGNLVCNGTITVPNGTAAAPGIRLTSEASGLYRYSATELGFAVAGTASAILNSSGAFTANGTVTGGRFLVSVSGGNAQGVIYASAAHGFAIQCRTGSTSDFSILDAAGAAYICQVPPGTSAFLFNNTTDATTTSDGSVRLSGGLSVAAGKSIVAGARIVSVGATSGIGYATGAGATVAQATSRTTGVTINNICGGITLFSTAGSTTPQSFTVTNSAVAATDVIWLSQKSGTDKYVLLVTAVAAGSFQITAYTTGGTTSEAPVINFAVMKAVQA